MKNSILKPTAKNVKLINPIEVEPDKKIRYAAYVRVSSNSNEQLNSYAQQISHYIKLFTDNEDKWELVDIYSDEAITGTSLSKREDFQRMLTDCRLGKIDKIITKSVSRFSRDNIVTLSTIRELSALGISVYFEDDKVDTLNMSTEFLLSLQGMVAQQGSQVISKNCKKGFQIRAENGSYKQSKKPYGFDLINKELVINLEESKIVKRIYKEYLNGVSMTKIALTLTNEKVKSPSGNDKWHNSTIRNILTNERVIGDMLLQKKYCTDTLPVKLKINYGEKDMYYIEETHQAIIEKDMFERVQDLIKKKQNKRLKKEHKVNKKHIFSKVLLCDECGKTLRNKIVNNKSYWVCNARDKGYTRCNVTQIPEEEIKRAFIVMVNKLILHREDILYPMLKMLTDFRCTKNKSNEELKSISKKLIELAEQSNMLNGLRAKGIIDSAFCISAQTELNSKVQKLKKAKEQIISNDENDDILIKTKMIVSIVDNQSETIDNFDEVIFNSIIQNIIVTSKDNLIFKLINNLELPENLSRRNNN